VQDLAAELPSARRQGLCAAIADVEAIEILRHAIPSRFGPGIAPVVRERLGVMIPLDNEPDGVLVHQALASDEIRSSSRRSSSSCTWRWRSASAASAASRSRRL